MSASPGPNTKELYAFGPFRVDPERETVLRAGESVPLTPKTFQVLLVLIRNSKQVVTKDDLMRSVWPDTFVEEANLSRTIFMLRKALGETAQDHRYIVTVPGLGYRLAQSVQLIPEQEVAVIAASHSRLQVEVKETEPWRWIAAVVLLVAVAGSIWWLSSRRSAVFTVRDTVVLADFTNSTGDPLFDGTLREGLAIALQQSPFLSLITDQHIQETLKLMGQPPDARLTPAIAREVCERTASAAVLDGSIASLGSQYVLGLRATDCHNGKVLAEEQVQAARKEDVLNALGQVASRFRTRVGESLATVEKYDTPLAEATTPSLEALKAYSLGRKRSAAGGVTTALPFYRRAVELDPNFAMTYYAMATIYRTHQEPERAAENIRKAYELREKVSERERFSIEAGYYSFGTGEMEKAAAAYELWQQTYPRDYAPYGNAAVIYRQLGNREKALQESSEALRLNPNATGTYQNLGADYVNLNRLDEAEAVYKQADERHLPYEGRLKSRYLLAFLKNDPAQMEQLASTAMGRPGEEDLMLGAQADTATWYGKLKDAQELTRRAMDCAQHNDTQETAAGYQAAAALFAAESGKREQARADADAAMKLSPTRNVQELTALALARAGDAAAAEKLAGELDKAFPLDTLVQRYWLPAIRAAVAMQRNDPSRAIELLQTASDMELYDGRMLPVFLRGEAYLMLHDGKRAATEFQKYIDRRGLVRNAPWGALARLGLARSYAMQGDTAKARAAYQDFLTIWKDADPDLPILIQAKAEYATLQ